MSVLNGDVRALSSGVLATLLHRDDARRATAVLEILGAHGLRCVLTGGLAIHAQLRAHGRPLEPWRLNDIDLVVDGFSSIPESLAGAFLLRHVHPDATDGRTLLQLVDQPRGLRIDLFRALGDTLSRARRLDDQTGVLEVVSVEDLVARTTSHVSGRLRQRKTIESKHVTAFRRLSGLGRQEQLAAAWNDHRQQMPGTLEEASDEALRLLHAHPELAVVEEYSREAVSCERCRERGPFRPSPPERIVEILGYC